MTSFEESTWLCGATAEAHAGTFRGMPARVPDATAPDCDGIEVIGVAALMVTRVRQRIAGALYGPQDGLRQDLGLAWPLTDCLQHLSSRERDRLRAALSARIRPTRAAPDAL